MTDSDQHDRPQTHAEKMRAARASAIGLQFGISIAIGALGGNWLDRKFGASPWFLMLGVIFGAAAGFRDLWALAKSDMSDEGDS